MEPFLSEIRMFSFEWAPKGWAKCDGSLMSIAQNNALFALLGVQFGGNGTTTFALPDLRGRAPVHVGVSDRNSPSYSTFKIGAVGGTENVSLTQSQMPAHNHLVAASTVSGTVKPLANDIIGAGLNKQNGQPSHVYAPYNPATQVPLATDVVSVQGAGAAHQNCQPSLAINFCIAVQGIFHSRN